MLPERRRTVLRPSPRLWPACNAAPLEFQSRQPGRPGARTEGAGMGRMVRVVAAVATMVVLSTGAAFAATLGGHERGGHHPLRGRRGYPARRERRRQALRRRRLRRPLRQAGRRPPLTTSIPAPATTLSFPWATDLATTSTATTPFRKVLTRTLTASWAARSSSGRFQEGNDGEGARTSRPRFRVFRVVYG